MGVHSLCRGFLAEKFFFRATLNPKNGNDRAKEEELLNSKKWKRFSVHTAFELGNLYSQRMENARSQEFPEEMHVNAQKAVEAYTDALRSNPSYNEVFEARARALRVIHREEEASLDMRMALLIQPLPMREDSPLPEKRRELFSIVREEAQRGRWKEAHSHAEDLIVLFPEDPLPRLMSADTAAQLGDDTVAILRYREFLLKQPNHPEARENLAIVLERQDRHEEAIALRRAKP